MTTRVYFGEVRTFHVVFLEIARSRGFRTQLAAARSLGERQDTLSDRLRGKRPIRKELLKKMRKQWQLTDEEIASLIDAPVNVE